jgi:hypothetical protein
MRILLILIESSPEKRPDGTRALDPSIWEMHRLNHGDKGSLLETDVIWREGFRVFGILLEAKIVSGESMR